MITPLWFSNALDWIAQVALLVLAAGLLPHIFKIRQPQVLLTFWRTVVGVSLLLPLVQPWHRQFYPLVEFTTFTTVTLSNSELSRLASTAGRLTYWQAHKGELIAQTFGVIILAGIAARFTILALGLVKLRQFRRASSPISDHSVSSAVLDEMRVRVNTGGEFRISSDVDSPVTFGLSAPVILLPERFPTLDAQYQSAIACHELLHVRRCDWAHHLSEEILRAALWFHPAIAWLISRIRLSREQVVDLEVINLTGARKPYLEALLEFTNSRALATAIPAPPFLVERQLAERVALMLKEVRMSRTRLIASLTAIAACLAVVATLAVWTFPLKAAPQYSLPPIQSTDKAEVHFVSGGINGGVGRVVVQGVPVGVAVGVTIGGVTNGTINGVPGGVVGGVKNGVTNGVPGGITNGQSAPPQSSDQKYLVGGVSVDPIPGSQGHFLIHANPPVPVPKIVVTDIKFEGQVHDADAVRARVIKYSQAKNWDATDPDWLDELAEVGVRGDLQDRGYFEAMVEGVKSQILESTPTQQRVVASFTIKEGDQFRTGEFTFVGFDSSRGPVIPVPQMREQFHLQTGEILNVDELRHGIERIFRLYGARGYIDFTATPKFSIDHQGRTIAMNLTLAEGNQYHVASLTVRGLDSATTASLESRMRPGSVYDTGLLRELVAQGNAASGANVSFETGVPITRNAEARTLDIVLDFSPKSPQPAQPTIPPQAKTQYVPAGSDTHASDGKMNQVPSTKTPSAVANDSHIVGKFTPVTGSAPQTNGVIARAGQNGITMPKCEYCPKPEYSPEARDANLQGTVYLQVVVLANGRAGEIKVTKGFEESLDKQAIKIIRQEWTFKPATDRNGDPVNVIVPVEIVFQLYGPPQAAVPTMGSPVAAFQSTPPLAPNESWQAKIFKGPVTNNGASTPSYMGLVNTQPIHTPQPELPRLARQANVQGSVTLNTIVNTEGKVIAVEYVKGPAMLVQAAIDAVRNWIIKGTHDGVPVTFQISVEVIFSDK